jgi:phosphate transport system substrate-binding protein
VSRNQSAIGHGGIAYGRATKLIRINDPATGIPMTPSRENVLAGTYPLRRSLYLYVHPHALRPEVREFLAWICGESGQSIVEQVGYFPLPAGVQQRMLTEKLKWTPAAKPEP